MTGLTLNNNTIIQTAAVTTANFSAGFYADMGGTASNIVIHDNYVDPSGPLGYTGSPWFPDGSYGDNLAPPTALSNMIDMVTGQVIPVPSKANPTSQGYYTYADGSGYTPALSDVFGIKASQTSGTLAAGNTVTFTVTMDLPQTVTGAPALTLNDGGTATYVSGSGTNTLVFSYTVASGNTAVSSLGITGVSLPSGASIKDSVGNAANMAGVVASFSGLAVNPGSGSGGGSGGGSGSGGTPTAVADSATTEQGQAKAITVLSNDTDAGGTLAPASVLVSTAAVHGTATVNTTTGAITYTPTAGYTGTDTFKYTVADTSGTRSAPATVTVTVDAPPTTVADSATTAQNQAVSIAVLGNDTDTVGTINPGSVAVSAAAVHGTTSVNSTTGAITYTPTAGFTGTDTFKYTAANTAGGVSAPATVTVTVSAASGGGSGGGTATPPTAAADSGVTVAGKAVSIAVLGNDTDVGGTINPASVAVSTAAVHGTTSVNTTTGAITYTPTAGYTGTDTFKYTVANTQGGVSTPATVTVTVSAPSGGGTTPAPTTVADSGVTEENKALSVAVLSNDTDVGGTINPASVAVSAAAAHGTTSVNSTTGAITYTPAAGYFGTDTFKYTVANMQGVASTAAMVNVTVDAPPTAAADSATTTQGQPVTISILGNDSDPIGTINPGSVAVSSAAVHGTTSISPTTGAITYTPAAGFTGTDTFKYTVANTLGGVSAPATVSIQVGAPSGGGGGSGSPPPPPGAQLPDLFAGYAVRPSWQVAGVDYAVGVPSGTTLLDPNGISMRGVSVNASSHVINVFGNGVVLNGYDFSLNGGWRVNVTGRNDTIENSNFKVGANEQIPITARSTATNLSVLHNTIDGGGASGDPGAITALVSDTGSGLTVEYNWLKNAPQTVIAVKGGTLIDEFNLIQNVGFGADSAESDLTFSGGVSNNSVISFNTIYNPPHAGGPDNLASGLQVEAQNHARLINTSVENNTIISPGPTPTNTYLIAVHQDFGPNIVNGVNIQDNFLDSTGASAAYFPTTRAGNVAFVDNINLKTGSVVPGIPGTASTSFGT
jgi:hypothetical protein